MLHITSTAELTPCSSPSSFASDGFIEEDVADDTDDHRRRAAADNQRLDRFRREEEDQNVEALAAELRERYGRSGRYAAQSDYAEVPQRLLMPSVDDPNLWGVPCKVSNLLTCYDAKDLLHHCADTLLLCSPVASANWSSV